MILYSSACRERQAAVFIYRLSAEFDALMRLGIPDPAGYIKKRYRSSKLLFLRAACVGQALVDQLEASVEEAVSSATWVDLQVARGPQNLPPQPSEPPSQLSEL